MESAQPPSLTSAFAWIDRGVRFTARTAAQAAAMFVAITGLLLIVPLSMGALTWTPTEWAWVVLLAVICAGNTVGGAYFYAELLQRRWPSALCVAGGYGLLLASVIGLSHFNHQLFVGLAALSVLVGVLAAEGFLRRCGDRAAAAAERLPKPVRWAARSARFWLVFVLAYVGIGIGIHDLFAHLVGGKAFVY